jgi:hypothetical protein
VRGGGRAIGPSFAATSRVLKAIVATIRRIPKPAEETDKRSFDGSFLRPTRC